MKQKFQKKNPKSRKMSFFLYSIQGCYIVIIGRSQESARQERQEVLLLSEWNSINQNGTVFTRHGSSSQRPSCYRIPDTARFQDESDFPFKYLHNAGIFRSIVCLNKKQKKMLFEYWIVEILKIFQDPRLENNLNNFIQMTCLQYKMCFILLYH